MKKALILIIILLTHQAYAFNGGKQSTFVPNMDTRELENSVKYAYLEEEYETKRTYSDGLTKCALVNKYYMPGNGLADSNGCFDILGYLETLALSGTEANYIGSVSTTGKFASLVTYSGGAFAADKLCNDAHSGSRAARASDHKYFLHEQRASVTGGARWYLLDGVKKTQDVSGIRASGYNMWYSLITDGYSCNNYTDDTTVRETPIFSLVDGGVQYGVIGCTTLNLLMCVTD